MDDQDLLARWNHAKEHLHGEATKRITKRAVPRSNLKTDNLGEQMVGRVALGYAR
jgi:hypothetical protein